MDDVVVEDVPESKSPSHRLDTILSVAVGALLAAVLSIGAIFGYSVWVDRQTAIGSNPAYRLIEDLKDEVRSHPNEASLRVRLGELMAGVGDYPQAIEQFEFALQIDPNHTGAYIDLGVVAMMTEDTNAARRYFLKVTELTQGQEYEEISNRRDEAFFNLGRLELSEGQYEESIGYFKEALRIRRDASDTYYYLARAYNGLGEQDAALEQLELALAFDPNFAQAHFLLGQIYLERDDLVNASASLYRAAKLEPDADPPAEALASLGTPEEWETKARDALESGDLDDSLDSVLIARNLDPTRANAIVLHGEILEKRDNPTGALNVYSAALELEPDNQTALDAVARLEASNAPE